MLRGFLAFAILFFGLRVFADSMDSAPLSKIPFSTRISFLKDLHIPANSKQLPMTYEEAFQDYYVRYSCNLAFDSSSDFRVIRAGRFALTGNYFAAFNTLDATMDSGYPRIRFECEKNVTTIDQLKKVMATRGILLELPAPIEFNPL